MRTDPSAPTDAKMSFPCANARSYTSRSWAMSCVRAVWLVTSHMVQVVSMDPVPMMFGSASFQSKDVSGAQYSLFLLLLNMTSFLADTPEDSSSTTFHIRK